MSASRRSRRIRVFDTTLRDGEQTPGAALTVEEKVTIARQLARLRVDVIEAGFPAASPGETEAVHRIAAEVGGSEGAPAIAALARCVPGDVTVAAAALQPARRRPRARIPRGRHRPSRPGRSWG